MSLIGVVAAVFPCVQLELPCSVSPGFFPPVVFSGVALIVVSTIVVVYAFSCVPEDVSVIVLVRGLLFISLLGVGSVGEQYVKMPVQCV